MASTIRNVIVVGASGNIGHPITRALVDSGHFVVSALTRPNSRVSSKLPSSVKVLRADYGKHYSLVKALHGQDAVICTIATSNLVDQRALIDAAAEAGVRRFVPSEFGFDTEREDVLDVAPCCILKRDPVEKLKSLEGTGMEWTSIVTGPWVDFFLEKPDWPWWDLQKKTFVKFDDGEEVFEFSTLAQVARAVVAVLSPLHLEKTRNQYVFVRSGRLTQNRVLGLLQEQGGGSWIVVQNSAQDVRDQGYETFGKWRKNHSFKQLADNQEFQMSIAMMITGGIMGLGGVCRFEDKAKLWMQALGLSEENPAEIVTKAAKAVLVSQKNLS